MAPEYPPSLVIVDLAYDHRELRFKTKYIERPDGMRLRVRWIEETIPNGFRPVGGGVTHVLKTDDLLVGQGGEGAVPRRQNEPGYMWAESIPPGAPWRMLVMIFPAGHVAFDLRPYPEGVKRFGDRLATFWVLQGDQIGRDKVSWQLKVADGDLLSAFYELQEIGRSSERIDFAPSPLSVVTESCPLIFLSYSHKNEAEKNNLLTHLRALQMAARKLDVWSDDVLSHGEFWQEEIDKALGAAKAAVLLVTSDFLASDFIQNTEVPTLLKRRKDQGLKVFPVIAKHCAWRAVPWLAELQVRPKNGAPVWSQDTADPDEVLSKIVEEIAVLV
jgi:hypothetical protein